MFCEDSYKASEGADAVIILTEWNVFRELDLKRIKEGMSGDVFMDFRGVSKQDSLNGKGFNSYLIGMK